ncbi:DUF3343 domain-containing protein [Fuchsiella alkaliacetigena]|uniref:DUF3343 domain-containing protein n=1 Tax=Fuchsiella alkaliacetigena TaxID=957042 RepID=UPI00200A0002|nr:DUF3343 domain-containing protein [Fuchsiella alkaliacetigena]MCK8825509.1 DUF3343 domain-containing protein [Fuchsiella alkaliacetigena]
MEREFCVITFDSTHQALDFERLSKEYGLKTRSIPVPRQISSSCGIAAKFNEELIKDVRQLCLDYQIEFANIYRIYRDSSKKPVKIL